MIAATEFVHLELRRISAVCLWHGDEALPVGTLIKVGHVEGIHANFRVMEGERVREVIECSPFFLRHYTSRHDILREASYGQ